VEIPEGVSGFRKLLAFLGPGLLVAIAYVDPGNVRKFILLLSPKHDSDAISWVS
jgi:hypothetical protein